MLIGLTGSESGRVASRLAAYAIDNPATPLWRTPIEPPEISMPAHLAGWVSGSPREEYRCTSAAVGDMCPDLPGDEVAVGLTHASKSPSCAVARGSPGSPDPLFGPATARAGP